MAENEGIGTGKRSGASLASPAPPLADTAQCGSCEYLPHPPSLSVPWDCGYISTACGRPGGENHKGAGTPWSLPSLPFPHACLSACLPSSHHPLAAGAVDAWRRPKEEDPVIAAIYGNVTGAVR